MQRSGFINEMGSACMSAIVKQQEEKKKRGADNLPAKNELKHQAVAYRATLAETVYKPDETVRPSNVDLLMQNVIKRYDLDRKLDEINFDTPDEIIAAKNAFKEVAVAYCKEKGIAMADDVKAEKEIAQKEPDAERKSFILE